MLLIFSFNPPLAVLTSIALSISRNISVWMNFVTVLLRTFLLKLNIPYKAFKKMKHRIKTSHLRFLEQYLLLQYQILGCKDVAFVLRATHERIKYYFLFVFHYFAFGPEGIGEAVVAFTIDEILIEKMMRRLKLGKFVPLT